MKKAISLLLMLTMLLGMPVTALAEGAQPEAATEPEAQTTLAAEEMTGFSRLDRLDLPERELDISAPYADDELVTVIVQLDGPALIDYFDASTYAAAGEDLSAGERVSAFLTSADAGAAAETLLAGQDALLGEIGGLQQAVPTARAAGAQVQVVAQWTTVINGMAIRVPYGALEGIRALDGVKRAYVERVYELPEPVTSAGVAGYSYDMLRLNEVWDAGYTGRGMLVAVLDTGLDLEYATYWDDEANANVTQVRRTHEAFRNGSFKSGLESAATDLRYTRASLLSLMDNVELNANRLSPGASGEAIFKNLKVPFAYDYTTYFTTTGELVGGDVNVYPGENGSTHGTHVAGTVAGYAESAEGEVLFSGVAPDAQLLIMKIFPDEGGGAVESSIMNALEDAMTLGADVINLSLGADNGFSEDDTAAAEVYAKVEAAGVILMTSAGNSAYSSTMNARGDYYLSDNPDITMMSAPAVYDTNISVASVNNTVKAESQLVWNDGETDHTVSYADPTGVSMRYKFAKENEGIELIPVGGYGTWQDFYDAGFRSYYGYGEEGKTGIALVKRGGTNENGSAMTFLDKINTGARFSWSVYAQGQMRSGGVLAVIIYDEDAESTALINMSVSGAALTACYISGVDGKAIVDAVEAGQTVTLKTVKQTDTVLAWDQAREMSEFSSWGAGPGLELKPEITAPGGNVWSAVFDATYHSGGGTYDDYNGAYGMNSGTSMSAPHMSGIAALVEQYVKANGLGAGLASDVLTNHLLVSTAVPLLDGGGTHYSPRLQGAGLADPAAAITTPAYIAVEGQPVGKLELGDDVDWTGAYDLRFSVHNLTGSAVSYSATAYILRPATGTAADGRTTVLDSDVLLREVDLGSITVPAYDRRQEGSGVVTVARQLALDSDEIAQLRELFPNGTYIEGFVILTDESGAAPQLSLPYLAFLGDWTAAPIFDSALWTDGCTAEDDPTTMDAADPWTDGDYTWMVILAGSAIRLAIGDEARGFVNLGQNMFDGLSFTSQTVYHKENIAISPNRDGYLERIDDVHLYQVRDAKLLVIEVRDAQTQELYWRALDPYVRRTLYDYGLEAPYPWTVSYFPIWEGTDQEGNVLPSGTQCTYTITAYGEGDYGEAAYEGLDYPVSDFESVDPTDPATEPTFNGHAMDKTGDVISFPVLIDTVAPKLEDAAVSFYEEDGRTYITGTVRDEDGALASVEVHPYVARQIKGNTDPSRIEYGIDDLNPFYSNNIYDPAMKTLTFTADVTEYVRTNVGGADAYYDFAWTGSVVLSCGDYAANDRSYMIRVAAGEGIQLTQTAVLMYPGDAFDLIVSNNTGSDAELTQSSSDPSVATVDEFGRVVAVAPGQTTITVTNGTSSAVCIVAVEERPTEVIDFKLSIEQFSGLKPNGCVLVKVTDLEPANVLLTQNHWVVEEDDPDLYIGLINGQKASSDGLSAELFLNYAATNDPAIEVPGASGTLTVTLNGVSRTLHIDWEDLYTYGATSGANRMDDDLISGESYEYQTLYVTQGETATLVARYRDASAHSFSDVLLYTFEGWSGYPANYPTTTATGLVLDGPGFYNVGGYDTVNGAWVGKLVNLEGYALPESIRLFTRYDYGGGSYYESEMQNYSGKKTYDYDPATGEIKVYSCPGGSSSCMVIRADGVVSEGNPAGEPSGVTYERPEGLYGPFQWAVTEGTATDGRLETFENVEINRTLTNGAYFTPAEPGVSYITASSGDGQYSVNFAVISEPVRAAFLELGESHRLMETGDVETLTATLTPEPTLDEGKEIIWKSFNESVVTVDENGRLTAVAPGYAYVTARLRLNSNVMDSCLVQVVDALPDDPDPDPDPDPGPVEPVRPITPEPVPQDPEPTDPPSSKYEDVIPGRWYVPGIDFVTERGLMDGTSETTFSPDMAASRAMVVTVLYRLAGEPEPTAECPFEDVKADSWYEKAVIWGYETGIVEGMSETEFAPLASVQREQLAAFLHRYAVWAGEDVTATDDLSGFADGGDVSGWAAEAMRWAVGAGLIEGTESGLAPKHTATRAQFALILMRYCEAFEA